MRQRKMRFVLCPGHLKRTLEVLMVVRRGDAHGEARLNFKPCERALEGVLGEDAEGYQLEWRDRCAAPLIVHRSCATSTQSLDVVTARTHVAAYESRASRLRGRRVRGGGPVPREARTCDAATGQGAIGIGAECTRRPCRHPSERRLRERWPAERCGGYSGERPHG